MLPILPEVKVYLNLMSDWIQESFAKSARKAGSTRPPAQHQAHDDKCDDDDRMHSSPIGAGTQQGDRGCRLKTDAVFNEDHEDDMLSFTPKRLRESTAAAGLGRAVESQEGPSSSSSSSIQPDDKAASTSLLSSHLAIATASSSHPGPIGYFDSASNLTIAPPSSDARHFIDASVLLQRRREEAVFGLDGKASDERKHSPSRS
jgi:hypothetical protein